MKFPRRAVYKCGVAGIVLVAAILASGRQLSELKQAKQDPATAQSPSEPDSSEARPNHVGKLQLERLRGYGREWFCNLRHEFVGSFPPLPDCAPAPLRDMPRSGPESTDGPQTPWNRLNRLRLRELSGHEDGRSNLLRLVRVLSAGCISHRQLHEQRRVRIGLRFTR